MGITHIKGDLLKDSSVNVICHQVNCQGRMGSGIAKSIREKWPVVYEAYRAWYYDCEAKADEISMPEWSIDASEIMLGQVKVVPVSATQKVANLAGQQYYGYDGMRYTSYDAFWNCLHNLRMEVAPNEIIGFPKCIGCGLGGANWNVIETMIEEVFKDYEVRIYEL